MTIASAAFLLVLVMDPFGNIPVFLTTLKNVEPERQTRVVVRELLIALGVLIVFLFFGSAILAVLGISEPALSLAGAIILFLISLRMIFPGTAGGFDESLDGEPFIVPLAIPFVAGPSAMAAILLITTGEPERRMEWLVSLLIAWGVTGLVLCLATRLERFLGQRGLVAMERLMGMLLTAVAVQMFMSGLETFLAGVR